MSPYMPSSATTEAAPVSLDDVLEAFRSHYPDGDVELLRRAHDLAAEAHQGQVRKTGEPYISHPVAVAHMLAQYGLDAATIAAAFLHDTVEDTPLTLVQVEQEFGKEIAELIDGVTKLDRVRYTNREQAQAASDPEDGRRDGPATSGCSSSSFSTGFTTFELSTHLREVKTDQGGTEKRLTCTPRWPTASEFKRSSTNWRTGAFQFSIPGPTG
jgi:hypothetical protein